MKPWLSFWSGIAELWLNHHWSIYIGLSPGCRQAIIWTNAGILLFRTSGTNFSESLIAIITFSFKKMRLKVSSEKRQPFYLGLNVLTKWPFLNYILNDICWNWFYVQWFKVHQSLFLGGGIASNSSLIQVMAWCQTGDNQLPMNKWWRTSLM